MNSKKLKRILSVALSLSMALSTNMTGFAAGADALADEVAVVEDDTATSPEECEEDAHDWEVIEEIRPATCSQKGAYKVKCKICGKEDYSSTSRTGHTYELDGFVEITQEDIEAGEAPEGAVANTVITKKATCSEKGTKKYICSTCEEGAAGHESEPVTIDEAPHEWKTTRDHEPATCTESAYYYTKCKNCDATKDKTVDEDEPKLYHTYEKQAEDYDPISITEEIDGDCTKEHKVTYTCTRTKCMHTETGTIKHSSHALGTETSSQPTCEYPEMSYKPCTRTGCTVRSDQKPVEGSEKLYHTYEEGAGEDYDLAGSITTNQPATCTEDGEIVYTCQRPECTEQNSEHHTKTETLGQTGHDYTSEKSTSEVTKSATCIATGEKTIHCGNAPQNKDHDKTESIPMVAHSWTDVPKKDATCGKPGLEAYTWCPVCKQYKDGKKPAEIPADPTKHQYDGEPTIYKAATCTENGVGKYVCTGCKESSVFKAIPAMHEYQKLNKDGEPVVNEEFKGNQQTGSTVTGSDATCLTKGYKTYTCGKCDADVSGHTVSVTIDALGHEYNDGVVTTDPTCVKKGVKTFTCQRCTTGTKGHSYTQEVAATGQHNYTPDTIIPATCTTPQKKGSACSFCKEADPDNPPEVDVDENDEPVQPAYGHTYEEAQYQTSTGEIDDDAYKAAYPNCFRESAATCADGGKDGEKVYTCAREGCEGEGHTKTVKISAPEHKWEAEYEPANCQHAGYAYEKCKLCEEETEPEYQEKVDPKKEHNYVLQTPVYKPASCTANGIGQYKCSMCKDVKNKVIPAHHAYEDENHEVLTGNALKQMVNDNRVSVETKKAATCAAAGEAVYTCEDCDAGTTGKEKPVTLTKLEHIYGNDFQWKSVLEGGTHYDCVDDTKVWVCTQPNCPEALEGHTQEEGPVSTAEHTTDGVSETVQNATCTEAKKMVKICTVCQGVGAERVATDGDPGGAQAALGHTYKEADVLGADGKVDEKKYKEKYPNFYKRTEASCEGQGTKGEIVYTCANPGCEGEDHTLKVEIKVPDHVWVPKFKGATCQANAQSYDECQNCGKETEKTDMGSMGDEYKKVDHNYQLVEAFREADCTKAGLGKYQCPMCKATRNEVTPAHHAYEDEKHEVLTGKALQDMVDGNKVSIKVKTSATCTAQGEEIYTCLLCADGTENKEKTVQLEKLKHRYDPAVFTWESVKDGGQHFDCQDDVKIFTCQQTGCTQTRTETVTATQNHDTDGVTPTEEEATCTLPKRQVKICKTCGGETEQKTVTGDEAQAALGHAFQKMKDGKPVVDENGENVLVDDVESNPLVKAEGKLPTCTEGSERTYTCLRCKDNPEQGNQVKVNVPKKGHDKEEKYIAATCEEPGKVIMVCKNDPSERFAEEDRVLKDAQGNIMDPALGHDEMDVSEVESTCKTKGHTAGVQCRRCRKVLRGITDLPLDPENHDWDEDIENTVAPDCATGTPGVNAYMCVHEGIEEPFRKTENVDAEHSYGKETVSADGKYIIHTCGVCGHVENLKLMYGYIKCTNSECESFGEIVEADEIARVAPTCTQKGKTKGLACPDCETVLEGCEDIAMIDHDTAWVTTLEPTCGEAGSKVQRCSKCKQDIGEAQEVPATGMHEYEAQVKDPDCEHAYKLSFVCEGCGQEDPERPAEEIGAPLGHNYVNGVCANNCGIAPIKAVTEIKAFVDTKNKVRLTALTKVNDKKLTVVEMGLLYSTDGVVRTEGDFQWYEGTASKGWLKKKILSDQTKDGVYMDIGVGSLVTRRLYGRAYVVTEDAAGKRTFTYGDLLSGTFEGLNKE